jgi:Tfp pilus assembly protein PilZ
MEDNRLYSKRRVFMSKKVFSLLILVSLMLVTVLSNSVGASLDSNDTEMYIDPSITGEERATIAEVMKHIPPDERENVIYIDHFGKIFANKPELKEEIYKLEHVKDNIYLDKSGNEFVAPTPKRSKKESVAILFASEPNCSGGSGPYRRVHSKLGYSWMSSYVYLPGGTEIEMKNVTSGDTGHIYSGGNSNDNTAVDAGFQYSQTYDNWAPFIHTHGKYYNTDVRFKVGQDAFLKFYVPQDGQVALYVAGYATDGSKVSRTIAAASSGWTSNGTGNNLKRLTTIAQKVDSENFTTGSHIKNVH